MIRKALLMSAFLVVGACGGGGGGGGGGNPGPANVNPGGNTGGGSGGAAYTPRKWNEGIVLSNPIYSASNPIVKVSDNGMIYAAWVETTPNDGKQHLFATVFDPALVEDRNDLTIDQVDNETHTVDRNIRWNYSLIEQEVFQTAIKMVVNESGAAFLAWTVLTDSKHVLWVSNFAPQTNVWSEPLQVSADEADCDEISLHALKDGSVILLWKNEIEGTTNLSGALYASNGSDWSDPIVVSPTIKDGSPVSLWEGGTSIYMAVVQPVDAVNDKLVAYSINLSNGLNPQETTVDATGLKTSVVGVSTSAEAFLFWAERDANGYFSVIGSRSATGSWTQLPNIESDPQDAGHLVAATIGEEVHLVWKHRYSASNTSYLFDDLRAVTIKNGSITDNGKIFGSGAANPILLNGDDGKLYLEWFASHSTYAEYVPSEGWKASSRPFCYQDLVGTSGTCYNSGTEHGISVKKGKGAATWLHQEGGLKQVIVSLSM